jgi:hypothetical protein
VSSHEANRLGARLESCGDGTERMLEFDPTGRIAKASQPVAQGHILLTINGQPATQVKAALAAGTLVLPASEFAITVLAPGGGEPVTIAIPALGDDAPELAITTIAEVPITGDDLLDEISDLGTVSDLERIVLASFGKAPFEKPLPAPMLVPAGAPPQAAHTEWPAPQVKAVTPVRPPLPALEEHPADRARREYDAFQVFRLSNMGEPGDALRPAAASAVDRAYNPFST